MNGHKILVTGGSSGIGRQTVRLLSAIESNRIAVLARRPFNAWELPPESFEEDAVELIPADLNCLDRSYRKKISDWTDLHPDLDTLILCAAVYGATSRHGFLETTSDEWNNLFRVNIDSAYHVAHQCLPYLIKNNGLVVVVSSLSAIRPEPEKAAYAASKAALHSLFTSLAEEYKDDISLHTVLISPSDVVATPGVQKRRSPDANLSQYLDPRGVATIIAQVVQNISSFQTHIVV